MLVAFLIFSLFGYTTYQLDRTSVDGHIQPSAFVDEITEDLKDIEAEFAKGGSANHNRYND